MIFWAISIGELFCVNQFGIFRERALYEGNVKFGDLDDLWICAIVFHIKSVLYFSAKSEAGMFWGKYLCTCIFHLQNLCIVPIVSVLCTVLPKYILSYISCNCHFLVSLKFQIEGTNGIVTKGKGYLPTQGRLSRCFIAVLSTTLYYPPLLLAFYLIFDCHPICFIHHELRSQTRQQLPQYRLQTSTVHLWFNSSRFWKCGVPIFLPSILSTV